MIKNAAVDALAGAIVDGTDVDWAAAESNAASESQRKMIRDLKLIAAIAELHESTPVAFSLGTVTWPPPIWTPSTPGERSTSSTKSATAPMARSTGPGTRA